jgi:hypothetical protein
MEQCIEEIMNTFPETKLKTKKWESIKDIITS